MNDPSDTDPIAVLLTSVQPAALPPALMERLRTASPQAPVVVERPKISWLRPALASAAGIVIAVSAGVWAFLRSDTTGDATVSDSSPAAQSSGFSADILPPPWSSQKLIGVRELGITRDAQSRPVRLMHTRWLDNTTWSRGDGSPPVHESRVRDEIVPVVLTTH
jgi:hypothetical protein